MTEKREPNYVCFGIGKAGKVTKNPRLEDLSEKIDRRRGWFEDLD
uniref:Uncharacterized protein n=1 Tax=Utricularia reniformis TaxID=192314 RepID=A0A1Y0B486_9LAMI|nr:hypothetical protein AEK19_MT2053 [Utricularia reniformis]ART32210.1 hypothetical protein AEK19_MT2053 [Utricularia reniformis]